MNRADRLYAIVEELRAVSPRPRTAAWLAERFEISTRTIERDLTALREVERHERTAGRICSLLLDLGEPPEPDCP